MKEIPKYLDDLPTVEEYKKSKIDPVMDEWIKVLEENSISKRQTTHIDGDLSNNAPHISYWKKWEPKIHLGGYFTIEQLEALINHMKKYND